MGIDHGLGGSESQKAKLRREKKAKMSKRLVRQAISSHENIREGEIVFDETSRLDFIQGFRKRKADRRKHGLAMELLKQQKAKREMRKELRGGRGKEMNIDEITGTVVMGDNDDSKSDSEPDSESMGESKNAKKLEFADEHTTSMFEGSVSVVVDDGIAEELDEMNNFEGDTYGKGPDPYARKKEPTRYEKAMKQVKSNLGSKSKKQVKLKSIMMGKGKKAKKQSLNAAKKRETGDLLRKAVGDAAGKFKAKAHKSKSLRGGGKKKSGR